jgi:hypothetical protein
MLCNIQVNNFMFNIIYFPHHVIDPKPYFFILSYDDQEAGKKLFRNTRSARTPEGDCLHVHEKYLIEFDYNIRSGCECTIHGIYGL